MNTMNDVRNALRKNRNLKGMMVKGGGKSTILLDVTGDGLADIALMDVTGDGNIDTIAIDTDDNGYYDTVLIDSDGNNVPDTIIFGNVQKGTISEIIRGKEVEDAIIEMTMQIVNAAMEHKVKESIAAPLSSEIETRIAKEAEELRLKYIEMAVQAVSSDKLKKTEKLKLIISEKLDK